ncbi:hypothetical protein HPB48_021191 [Haemaphysalis longicornis]|uniref:Uncharacterized protein n=1 Tax=Haemaphysalis longicornis TaxID=44386 RepID=A0A9J6GHB1_HAELO|nr:hypothetical protein HPB48_021190 [Haemaphysalis longicornis]KAH9374739.1 hypothetical protein HPB48_021191 [Haemaphysalis longicornis]
MDRSRTGCIISNKMARQFTPPKQFKISSNRWNNKLAMACQKRTFEHNRKRVGVDENQFV